MVLFSDPRGAPAALSARAVTLTQINTHFFSFLFSFYCFSFETSHLRLQLKTNYIRDKVTRFVPIYVTFHLWQRHNKFNEWNKFSLFQFSTKYKRHTSHRPRTLVFHACFKLPLTAKQRPNCLSALIANVLCRNCHFNFASFLNKSLVFVTLSCRRAEKNNKNTLHFPGRSLFLP